MEGKYNVRLVPKLHESLRWCSSVWCVRCQKEASKAQFNWCSSVCMHVHIPSHLYTVCIAIYVYYVYIHTYVYIPPCVKDVTSPEHQAVWDCVTWHQGRCCSRMHVALSVVAPHASGAVNIQKLAQFHRWLKRHSFYHKLSYVPENLSVCSFKKIKRASLNHNLYSANKTDFHFFFL